jgi:hypothetical protein
MIIFIGLAPLVSVSARLGVSALATLGERSRFRRGGMADMNAY